MSVLTETKTTKELYHSLDFDPMYYISFLKNEFNIPTVITIDKDRPDNPVYPDLTISLEEAEMIYKRIRLNYGLYSQIYRKEENNNV